MPITYSFTGTVSSANANSLDPAVPFVVDGTTVLSGDIAVSGSFTFDFDTVPVGSDGTVPGGMLDWTLTTEGHQFHKRLGGTFQYITVGANKLRYVDEIPDATLGPDVFELTLNFSGDPLGSTFLGGTFGFFLMDYHLGNISGTIDSLAQVPEPSPLWLLAAGLSGLLYTRRRPTPCSRCCAANNPLVT